MQRVSFALAHLQPLNLAVQTFVRSLFIIYREMLKHQFWPPRPPGGVGGVSERKGGFWIGRVTDKTVHFRKFKSRVAVRRRK